jgi:hypothetical protein
MERASGTMGRKDRRLDILPDLKAGEDVKGTAFCRKSRYKPKS